MTKESLKGMLDCPGKPVEVYEIYGRPRKKTAVLTFVDRQGEARTVHVKDMKKSTFETIVRPNIDGYSVIKINDAAADDDLGKHFWKHKSVRHKGTLVRGIVHTNFAESYHSLLKRSIIGTHHHTSEKHLSRNLREREFIGTVGRLLVASGRLKLSRVQKGKRLMYRMQA